MLVFKVSNMQTLAILFYLLGISSTQELRCSDSEFLCSNKRQCIPITKFCDGTPDCGDKSDELRYQRHHFNASTEGIACRRYYYTCILPDHMITLKQKICLNDLTCGKEEFRCTDGSGCLPSSWFCGGINDCVDGSDENQYISEYEQGQILYRGCLLDQGIICDNNVNFKNGIDECLCPKDPTIYSDDRCFRCLMHSQTVLTVGKLCDGVFDCPDLSDECMCGRTENMEICKNITFELSHETNQMERKLMCEGDDHPKMIAISAVCDGRVDCANSIDEQNCSKDCETVVGRRANHKCGGYECSVFGKKATSCDGIPVCASDIYGEECEPKCQNKPRLCNFVEEVPGKNYSTRVKCDVIDTSFEYLDGVQLCDGKKDCAGGEDEIDCPHRFYCKSESPYSIPEGKVCDQERDCNDGSDEPDTCSLRCDDDGDVEFVSFSQVCDGTKNCKDGLDECEPGCVDTAFSNNDSMMKHKGVLVLVSIISFMALIGNLIVIAQMVLKFIKSEIRHESERMTKIFILSLSFADLFVGIFTLAVCMEAASDNKRYCLHDREWRSSATCSALGVLVVIGSQQSVFTMVLITIFRVQAVSHIHSKSHSSRYIAVLLLGWVVSMLLGVIPEFSVFEDYFVDAISYDGNKLFATIKTHDKERFTKWLLMMENKTTRLSDVIGKIGSWSLLKQLIRDVNPSYASNRKFGFYSSHSVCLPTLFPSTESDTAWLYSLFLIVINFVAFFCIFAGGIIIYRKTSPKVSSDKGNSRSTNLKSNLTRIVVTDFFCWMPICIMAFLQVSGIDIPGDAYIPVGLLIIPINSALNPFLYSNIPEILWEKIEPARNYVAKQAARFKVGPSPSRENSSSGEQVGGGMTIMTARSVEEA